MSNADKLRELMAKYGFKPKDISARIFVSTDLVKAWLADENSTRHRPMKDRDFEYLKLKLERDNAKKT